jgi:tetratricopeptide (TPR) repeat protein
MDLGEVLLDLGRMQEAEDSIRKALAFEGELMSEIPNVFWYSEAVGSANEILSRIMMAEGRLGEAEQVLRRALAIAEKLAADLPSRADGLPALALAHADLGELLWEKGEHGESREHFLHAREAWEKMARSSPSSPEWRKGLAWLLADCPDAHLRGTSRAVMLAREAVAQSPHMVAVWDALGVALYRAEAAKEAVQPLSRSVEMNSGGAVKIWFFLAMALSRAGDRDQARLWYDKATGWMEKNGPKDPRLLRLRAEAAALLGVPELPADVFARPQPTRR